MKTWPNNLYEFLELEKPNVAKTDLMHAIVAATSQLSSEDNRILLLRFTCGYDVKEIAFKLNVAVMTVNKHLEKLKNSLLEPTVKPLFEHGYHEGMKKIKNLFTTYESDYNQIPIEYAVPEPQILKILKSAGVNTFGDINFDVSKLKGIGPKYNAVVLDRTLDLGWGSEIFYCEIAFRNKQFTTDMSAEENKMSHVLDLTACKSSHVDIGANNQCLLVPDLALCQAEITS